MSFLSRSVNVMFVNGTSFTLFKGDTDFSGCHNFTDAPPIIQPGQTVSWDCDNGSIPFEGVGGSVTWHVVEQVVPDQPNTELDEVVVTWSDPFIGGNSYQMSLTSGAANITAENGGNDTWVKYLLTGTAQSLQIAIDPEGSTQLGEGQTGLGSTSTAPIDIPVDPFFVGAWRNDLGTGVEYVSQPEGWAQFNVTISDYDAPGLGLVAISTYRDRDSMEQVYSGVWADGQGTGNQIVDTASTYDEFAALVVKYFSQNFRLVAMSGYRFGYVGVWRDDRGTGAEYITPPMTWDAFANQVAEYAGQGLSPVAICADDGDGFEPFYVGIFHDGVGSGNAIVTPAMNITDFNQVINDNYSAGLRPVVLTTFFHQAALTGSQSFLDASFMYVSVWRDDQGTPALWVSSARKWDDFESERQQQYDAGSRLIAYSAAQCLAGNL